MAVKKKSPEYMKRALPLFDRITADAAPERKHTNPWETTEDGGITYRPDFEVLKKLLGVPLLLGATTNSRVPAFALDLWLSYEFRRAGFRHDAVWPRAEHPRILPQVVTDLLEDIPKKQRKFIQDRIAKKSSIANVTGSSANILGKNYFKQVDVIMTNWDTGPELLISTKRMDSSFAKNAANRIEESYGDVKNLRARHPLAALGFMYGLRSTILDEEPDTAEWLIDLLGKLGQEEDAYDATCLLMLDYDDALLVEEDEQDSDTSGDSEADADGIDAVVEVPMDKIEEQLRALPPVTVMEDVVPETLSASHFLSGMANQILDTTPVTTHREARRLRREASPHDAGPAEMGAAHEFTVARGSHSRADFAPFPGRDLDATLHPQATEADT